jgi:hypothetical protein
MANTAYSTSTSSISSHPPTDDDPLDAILAGAWPTGAAVLDLRLDRPRLDRSDSLGRGADAHASGRGGRAGASIALLDPARPQDVRGADGVLLIDAIPDRVAAGGEEGLAAALALLDGLLNRHGFVILDLGAYRAAAPAPDAERLASAALGMATPFKLGVWDAPEGPRLIVKLTRRRLEPLRLTPLRSFRRNHASWPTDKLLLDERAADLSRAAQHVRFTIARTTGGDRVWIKTYEAADGARLAAMEADIGAAAAQALAELATMQPERAHTVRLVRPILVDGPSLIFPYSPDLFEAKPAHARDWSLFLPAEAQRTVALMAGMNVTFRGLEAVFLHNLCDFQVALGWDGLNLLDFEPNPWVFQLMNG